jgi:tagatose-1,6-bisphosphate aldolase
MTPYASAILLDPQYELEAANHRAKKTGLLLAYEASGYGKGRQPSLEKSLAFARVKPEKFKKITHEFSQDCYGVDVLKLEIPVTMRFVAGQALPSSEHHPEYC